MSALQQIRQEDQRLIILRFLAAAPQYTTNEDMLNRALASVGHRMTADATRAELAWLRDVKAVTIEDVAGLMIVRITRRGQDVVNDLIHISGITRPQPDL